MDNLSIIKKLEQRLKTRPNDYQMMDDLFEMLRVYEREDYAEAHRLNKQVRAMSAQQVKKNIGNPLGVKFYYLHKKALLFDARDDFDAYLQFLEYEREPEKKFYLPRRGVLKRVVDALQEIADGDLELLAISMPPGTGKTTLGIFFLTWMMGKYPNSPSLASAHSDKLTRSFYDGVLSIITDPEYLWGDVFPGVPLVGTNSKEETIDLDKPKRFKTLTCRSIDGSLTGATRSEKILYADDLVSGIEEALSKERLDSLWQKYTNNLRSRKKMGCKEIHIATRWSIHDPIGRLERMYGSDPKARFLSLSALNENGESNFDYKYNVGFSTQYFLDMKNILDEISWKCLYENQPVEREGLLFPENELQFYNGVLPEGEPDMKIAVCDIAWGGGDSLAMPFAYVYGENVYIHDVVFNKGDKEATRPVVVGKLKQHMPNRTRFEANNGGDEYADKVDELLKQDGVRLNITSRKAPSNISKLSRIIQSAPDIKKFYFLDRNNRSKEYSDFMKELTSFLQTGKNKHDDAPDSLAMLCEELYRSMAKVEVFKRPF